MENTLNKFGISGHPFTEMKTIVGFLNGGKSHYKEKDAGIKCMKAEETPEGIKFTILVRVNGLEKEKDITLSSTELEYINQALEKRKKLKLPEV